MLIRTSGTDPGSFATGLDSLAELLRDRGYAPRDIAEFGAAAAERINRRAIEDWLGLLQKHEPRSY